MPKNYVPVRFVPEEGSGYLLDIGTEIGAKGGFYLPNDIPDTEKSTILANIGAQPLSALGNLLPCSDFTGIQLRKLTFIRTNGNSFSVPVSTRANLLNAATVIRGVVDSNGSKVACIVLTGENVPDLGDELGLNYTSTFAVSHVATTGGTQPYHTGTILYETDVNTAVNSIVFQSIKSITDIKGSPSTQLSAAWADCVGDFENALACRGQGRKKVRNHRRYTLTFATKSNIADDTEKAKTETAELPVKSADSSEILACGQAAAALTGAYCIAYQGESHSEYHRILT